MAANEETTHRRTPRPGGGAANRNSNSEAASLAQPPAADKITSALHAIARTPVGRQYLSSGITTIPGQTFGIEIEFDGGDPEAIAAELYDRGLAATPYKEEYHSERRVPGKWIVERDGSVTGEIVSPVLTDSPETWAQLALVCEIIQKHGGEATPRTGAHVHVGVQSSQFSSPVEALQNVVQICLWAEDLLYRLSARPEAYPFHRGVSNGYEYCAPTMAERASIALDADNSEVIARTLSSHYRGLNLGNVAKPAQDQTVEFRYNDGSLDPEKLQTNIMVDCAVMAAAGRLARRQIPSRHHPLGSSRKSDTELLETFARLIMPDPWQRIKLYSAYERSMWQPSRNGISARLRSVQNKGVSTELARIIKLAKGLGGQETMSIKVAGKLRKVHALGNTLDPAEMDWLTSVVRCDETPGEAPSLRAKTLALRWLALPLDRVAPSPEDWRRRRAQTAVDIAGDDYFLPTTTELMARVRQRQGYITLIEQAWLRAVTSPLPSDFNLVAPTRATGQVYEEWMQGPRRLRGPTDLRDLKRMRTRWIQYQKLERARAEQDRVFAEIERTLGTTLSPEQQGLLSPMLRYEQSFDHAGIPETAVLSAAIGAAVGAIAYNSLLPYRAHDGRVAWLRNLVEIAKHRDELLALLPEGSGQTSRGGEWSSDARWLSTAMVTSQAAVATISELPPPSAALLRIYSNWEAALPAERQAAKHPLRKEMNAAISARIEEAQVVDVQVEQIADDLASHGRTPTPEEESWLKALLWGEATDKNWDCSSGEEEALKPDLLDAVIHWASSPAGTQGDNRLHWEQLRTGILAFTLRERARIHWVDGEAKIPLPPGMVPPTTEDVAWFFSWTAAAQTHSDTAWDRTPPSAAAALLLDRAFLSSTPPSGDMDLPTWERMRERWDHVRSGLVETGFLGQTESQRVQTHEATDWLTPMLSTPITFDMAACFPHDPSEEEITTVRGVLQSYGTLGTPIASQYHEQLLQNLTVWEAATLAQAQSGQLELRLVDVGTHPDAATAISQFMTGLSKDAPTLPQDPGVLLAVARWMASASDTATPAAALLEQHKARAWSTLRGEAQARSHLFFGLVGKSRGWKRALAATEMGTQQPAERGLLQHGRTAPAGAGHGGLE